MADSRAPALAFAPSASTSTVAPVTLALDDEQAPEVRVTGRSRFLEVGV